MVMKNKLNIYHFLILAGLLFSLYNVWLSYQSVEKIAASDKGDIANAILELPSLCTYNTGIFLAQCTSKSDVKPIEDIGCGDLGYPLLANVITRLGVKSSPLTKEDLVRINIWLNWSGLMLLVVALRVAGLKQTSLLTIFAGTYIFINVKELSADYYSTFWGVFCIALSGIIFLWVSQRKSIKRHALFSFWVAFFCLAIALLIREPMGYIGIAASLSIVLGNFVIDKDRKRKVLKYFIIGFVICSITLMPSILVAIRTLVWNVPKGEILPKHGFSYTLLIGIGTVPNSWGITRADKTATLIAKNVDPNVVHYSNRHFEIMKKIYFRMFLEKPLEMISIYRVMASRIIAYPTKIISYYSYVGILVIGLIICFWRTKQLFKPYFLMGIALSMSCFLALAQGILAGLYYSKTAEIGFIVSILALVEIFTQNKIF